MDSSEVRNRTVLQLLCQPNILSTTVTPDTYSTGSMIPVWKFRQLHKNTLHWETLRLTYAGPITEWAHSMTPQESANKTAESGELGRIATKRLHTAGKGKVDKTVIQMRMRQ